MQNCERAHGPAERTPISRRCRTRGAATLFSRVDYAAHRGERCRDTVTKAVQGQSWYHAELNPVRKIVTASPKKLKLKNEWRDRVTKGDTVSIPIRLLNRSTEIWGEDANEFRYAAVLLFLRPVEYRSLILECAI